MKNLTQLTNKNVLVTGASGFIGSFLSKKLLDLGAKVYAVSRRKQANDNLKWIEGDLTQMEFVNELISRIKPDTIFHLAGYVQGSREIDAVLPTFKSNLVSTLNILFTGTVTKCRRIILTGSLEESNWNVKEPVPPSPYAAAKLAGSAYSRMFHALYNTPVVIAKLFMVYGPNQKDHFKLIPYTILSLLRGEDPKFSSGRRLVDWIYVDDVVNGLIAIANTEGVDGKTIDIGSGKLVAIRDVILMIYELMKKAEQPTFGALKDRPMEKEVVSNVEETSRLTNWTPQISIQKGLKRTIDWYRDYYLKTKSR